MKKLKQWINDWRTNRLLTSTDSKWLRARAECDGFYLVRDECTPNRIVFENKAGTRIVIQ